eukprot:5517554-Pleurochrysis_carterae.AAC.1
MELSPMFLVSRDLAESAHIGHIEAKLSSESHIPVVMAPMPSLLLSLVAGAHALLPSAPHAAVASRTARSAHSLTPAHTRPGLAVAGRASLQTLRACRTGSIIMAGSVVVTDGSDSFYNSRAIFQLLHDFGKFKSITASSSSVSDAKKMLLSRQARYSGLVDVLSFTEADISEAFAKSDTWLAINADEAKLESQLAQAKAAGVKRVFITLSADGAKLALT